MQADNKISDEDKPQVGVGFDVEGKPKPLQDEELGNYPNRCSDEVGFNGAHLLLARVDEADGPEQLRQTHQDQAEVLAAHSL